MSRDALRRLSPRMMWAYERMKRRWRRSWIRHSAHRRHSGSRRKP